MGPQMLIGTHFGIGIRDREWFEHRLSLFSSVTAPSLLAQEDQSFHWALFVDSALPADIRERLDARAAGRGWA
jgi:Putative rhamnosyl transferase